MQLAKQKGFTLVEIAIVLVIVGLLIGGVLKGQEMITNAKLKRVESDNAGIAAAMFSYQDRYLQLPGDDNDAIARFSVYNGQAVADIEGDGSGTIDAAWDAENVATLTGAGASETSKFFGHLRAAGLIPGGGLEGTKPTNAYGGQIGVQDGALGISGHVTIFGQIEGPIAKIIEARLDDGNPDSGRMQSNLSSVVGGMASDPTFTLAAGYLDTARYNMAFRL
ncbi:MAG: prepilin-type N-terminal cleavage/methylation domain-containing protein [Gammaproteobacteria bacterium]|jgi:prepilin-type N-terminal cleavage/methylation domain-containing protein